MTGVSDDQFEHVVTIEGCSFYFDTDYMERFRELPRSHFNLRCIFDQNNYEDDERYLIGRHIDGSETVLELGGFIGVTACLINTRLGDRNRHVVAEVNPFIANYLRLNRDRNGCRFQVFEEQVVSATDRVRERYRLPKTIDIAELMSRTGLAFDTLVMDIEENEYDLIDQYPDFLRTLKKIFVEWHRPEYNDEYRRKLKRLGFILVDRRGGSEYFEKRSLARRAVMRVRRAAGSVKKRLGSQ